MREIGPAVLRTGRDKQRVAAQVAKCHDFAVRAEVLYEVDSVCGYAPQRRTRDEDAFERPVNVRIPHRRAFPAVSTEWQRPEAGDPERPEIPVRLPARADPIERQVARVVHDPAPMQGLL